MDKEEEENKKKVSQEFILNVKKYLEIDDTLNEIKIKTKILNDEKKIVSEYIINYLNLIDETIIDVRDGKLKKNIVKTKGSLKKDYIQNTLNIVIGDNIKASEITKQIIDSVPMKETISLKRTKNKEIKESIKGKNKETK